VEDGGEESMLVVPGASVVVEQVVVIATGLVGLEFQLEVGFKEVIVRILMREYILEEKEEGGVAPSHVTNVLMRAIVHSQLADLWESARKPIHHKGFGADIEVALGEVIAVASLKRGWSSTGWLYNIMWLFTSRSETSKS